jgi:hypothetical protein
VAKDFMPDTGAVLQRTGLPFLLVKNRYWHWVVSA